MDRCDAPRGGSSLSSDCPEPVYGSKDRRIRPSSLSKAFKEVGARLPLVQDLTVTGGVARRMARNF